MDPRRVTIILDEMATLLDLVGANPFKVRAFANGARALEALDEELDVLVAEARLTDVPGIGKTIAEAITSLATTGTYADYDELRASVPIGIDDMLRVPGLGPKRVRTLWKERDIASLDALERAAREGELRALPGFGKRTEEKILEGIEAHRRFAGRFLSADAGRVADRFVTLLSAQPHVEIVSIAGSLRRRLETVHDVDLLAAVAPRHRDEVMDAFVRSDGVLRPLGRGPTKSSVLTVEGMQVDLRAVARVEYPFALHHFTGSKEHNTALRGRAKARGLKMSEWGVFRGERRLRAKDESDVFGLLDLPWIAPELRENQGEIEAAEAGELPHLVETSDLRAVLHVHTTASDGRDSLRDMVTAAKKRGYRAIGISDHSVSAVHANGLDAERVLSQRAEVDSLRGQISGITIFHGIESDIREDGSLDYDDDVLASFDFVIASIHSSAGRDRTALTERIRTALRHPAVSILGHPTGRTLLAREGYDLDLDAIAVEAAHRHVALEINSTPKRLDLDWRLCRRARTHGVLFAIGADAHAIEGLDNVEGGVGMARKAWLTSEDVLNCRSVPQLRAFFRHERQNWKPKSGQRSRFDSTGELLP
jgi:DNA polymerase (family 10)